MHVAPRNIVPGDGPFAGFNRWLKDFYSESSLGWDSLLLEGATAALEW